ncbi:MAG: hypothetical protein JWM78_2284 [Verrucomicrobiaceae bacterium]|nr:hypothetical protein [Verrucomicrobiaceae bacterium]
MSIGKLFVALIAGIIGSGALAGDPLPAADTVPGVKDHPLLSRYAGSILVGYLVKPYDETELIAGPYKQSSNRGANFEKLLKVEGKITRIAYNYPRDRSGLEVMRNYQTALKDAGLAIIFSCEKDACGGADFGGAFQDLKVTPQAIAMPQFKGNGAPQTPFNYGRLEPRYLLASSKRADGAITYASVYVVPPLQEQNGGIFIEIVEPHAMEGDKVAVNLNAEQMARGINTDGKVALYGLYFDTDRADVRADSKPALDEMAKLLRQDPKLTVYIVGHTDNQGSYAHNLDLSQKRAEAIVKKLIADYKIEANRLSAKGAASIAPVASNDAETGRAKNRRVELVKQ